MSVLKIEQKFFFPPFYDENAESQPTIRQDWCDKRRQSRGMVDQTYAYYLLFFILLSSRFT